MKIGGWEIPYPLLLAKPIRHIFVSWQLYKESGSWECGHLIWMCKLILSVGSHKQHLEYPVDVLWPHFPHHIRQHNLIHAVVFCLQSKKKKSMQELIQTEYFRCVEILLLIHWIIQFKTKIKLTFPLCSWWLWLSVFPPCTSNTVTVPYANLGPI